MIAIYGLTSKGRLLARSTGSPDTPEWRVIHYLDKMNRSTPEQITEFCGMNGTQAAIVLRKLKSRGIIAEESGVNV